MHPGDSTEKLLDDWFEQEILPHEAALTRLLRRTWVNPSEVCDLRQEIYARVYERAARERPSSPRAFLIATARHLVVDRIRRERIVSIDFTPNVESRQLLIDGLSPERRLNARQELRRLADAIDQLPADCRAVIWLRRVEELSQREVAERLGMQEGTVASHLARGLRALTKVVLEGTSDDEEGQRDAHGGHHETRRK